ncbi:hypothetical protein SDC9_190395 [bioreactor metagenome]|uniref:Uncharacterized protein n=1 Tax=bioreactor metagenome TaxID=1076179 RepID=A0A645HV29_9ZZZZ
MCAFLFFGEKRPFQIDAQKHGASFLRPAGGVFQNAGQPFLRKGHGGRDKACHAAVGLISRYGLKGIRRGVTEITPHTAVEVDIGEPGNGVEAEGVHFSRISSSAADTGTVKNKVFF